MNRIELIRPPTRKIVLVLFCIAFPLFLLLLSYSLVLFFTDMMPQQKEVFLFLDNKGTLFSGFTPDEVSHLLDVKKIMNLADYIFYGLLLLITAALTYYKKDSKFVLKLLKSGGISTGIFILGLLLLSFFFFDAVFALFHQLFFPQGNWIFPADSLLIQTFPIIFFVTISRNIFLLNLFFGMIFIFIKYPLSYVRRSRN